MKEGKKKFHVYKKKLSNKYLEGLKLYTVDNINIKPFK